MPDKPPANPIGNAIREAVKREGFSGVEAYRRRHRLPVSSFYAWLGGAPLVPERSARPLRRLRKALKKAGLQHPLLDLIA